MTMFPITLTLVRVTDRGHQLHARQVRWPFLSRAPLKD
jgi:hypothetical protein